MSIQQQVHSSNLSFRIMASYLKFRERFRKPMEFLQSIGVERGNYILDYGCGIGSYSIPAAKMVGPEGKVFALDIHPLAIKRTKKRAEIAGLENLDTILSGLESGLPDGYVDFILLLDVFKSIQDKIVLLKEFHRVLKPTGRLIILIDHVSPDSCKAVAKQSGLFNLVSQEENLLTYIRA